MKIGNVVKKNQLQTEHKDPSVSNNIAKTDINPRNLPQANEPASSPVSIQKPNCGDLRGDQAKVNEPSNSPSMKSKVANMLGTNLANMPCDLMVRPRFGRKRPLSQSNADSQVLLQDASAIQSLDSQASQQLSSQFDGSCHTCKEYKIEIKRLLATNKRITRDAEAAKQRMDKHLSIALNGQDSLQKELILLRRNNEKQHVELTAIKALMREIQSAVGRYKF